MPPAQSTTVSVVLCTFNGERFLDQQLRSILAQTVVPDEIIISDDGSTDSTLAIARDFSARHPALTWSITARKAPLGVTENFASALVTARGDLIALCDQDDLWEPHRISAAVSAFRDESILLVHSDATLVDSGGAPRGSLMEVLNLTTRERGALGSGNSLEALVKRNLVTGATVMMRRVLLESALPIPPGWVHDEWLALIASSQRGLVFLDQPLIRYRQHGSNEIGAKRTDFDEAATRLREPRSQFFARKLLRNQGIDRLVASAPSWLSEESKDLLRRKVAFDLWRSAVPQSRLHRVVPVLSAWARGHYGRFARGYLDVIRDLVLTD